MKRVKKPESTNVKKEAKNRERERVRERKYKLKSFVIHGKAKLVCKFKRLHD